MAVQDNHPGVERKAKFRVKRKWNMKWISKPQASLIGGLLLLLVLLSPGTAYTDPVTDPVLEWNAIMRTTVATDNPFLQTHSGAMMHLAVFEAVNTIVGDYKRYLGTIEAPPGASPEAAAIAAAHRTLVSLHPTSEESLDDSRDASLSAIPDGPAKDDGIAVGEAAADTILALRANDGAANASDPPYTPGTEPGDWQPTPPEFPPALLPNWGKVPTFGIKNGTQFRSEPPPAIDTDKYARDYNDVKAVGDVNSTVRPQGKTDRARYFGVNPPVQVFGQSASQASAAQGKTLSENAQIFALLHMAMADGLISSMESKFYYEYWRPVTAIRAGDTDGNQETEPDPDWLSLVVTPPYPSYPSNYASAALAARGVLEEVYGKGGHSITLTSISPSVDVTLHYTTFSQMTDDINDARVYGGIHYRFDQEAGARQGWQVASYILRNHLRPVDHSGEDDESENSQGIQVPAYWVQRDEVEEMVYDELSKNFIGIPSPGTKITGRFLSGEDLRFMIQYLNEPREDEATNPR
jgi:PAP2 superfamily